MTDVVWIGVGLATACAFVAVALLAARYRGRPGAGPFVAMTVLLATMVVGTTLVRIDSFPDDDVVVSLTVFGPYAFASLAWVALAFEYTGRGPVMTRRRIAWLAGFGVAVVGVTGSFLLVPDSLVPILSLVAQIVQVTLVAATGYGAFLVVRSAVTYDELPVSGSLVLTTAGGGLIALMVVQLLEPFAITVERAITVIQLLLAAIAGLLLLTQVRYDVFEAGPSAGHLARETVLDEMDAAVAITDRDDRLLDCNRTAERTFGLDERGAIGEPIDDAFGVDPTSTAGHPTTIETSEGRRQFEVTQSTLTSRGGDPIGRAYLLRDVTERRTHEQRLDVLNRVLRHNLRNDLDAIRGFAEALERGDDLDADAVGRRIETTASDLADLGTAVTRAERLLAREPLAADRIDATALARRIAADADAPEGVSVTVSTAAAPIELRTDRAILETILAELVDNAIEHADNDPRVELAIEPWGPGVRIDVADDGPGIPDREQAVLLEGEETPLRHGSGVGLWLVYWGVVRLGGELEFRANEPRGSVVTVRIPDRSGGPTAGAEAAGRDS